MIGVQHVTNTANIRNENSIFNIITYLLLNSDDGIGCVYSPLGLVIFVAVEGTCMFYKRSRSLYFKFYSLRLLTNRPM